MMEETENWNDSNDVRTQSLQDPNFSNGSHGQVDPSSHCGSERQISNGVQVVHQPNDHHQSLYASFEDQTVEITTVTCGSNEGQNSSEIGFDPNNQATANPTGGYFVYTLDAPTSGFARRGEDTLTYLNKDQYYTLQLEYVSYPQATGELVQFVSPDCLTSLVSLQFPQREKQSKDEAFRSWELWSSRQPSNSLQALSVLSRIGPDHVQKVQDVSYNGVRVFWSPTYGPVQVKLAVKCLSTDFSNQKGVKGIPLYLQVDTYESEILRDRAVAQIKTFCDKGADRKSREEERRLARQPLPYPCQQAKTHTVFTHITNLMIEPVLYGPKSTTMKKEPLDQSETQLQGVAPLPAAAPIVFQLPAASQPSSFNSSNARTIKKSVRNVAPVIPPPIFLFVRQENEEIFTPLCLSQPTLDGMMLAISSKYQIEIGDIRHVYKRTHLGAIIHVDTEFVVGLAGSFFLMKVLVVEGTGSGPSTYGNLQVGSISQRILYDIVLCEMAKPQNFP